MTLFEAPEYDAGREKKKRIQLILLLAAIPVLAALGWYFRHWPAEHRVNKFFAAIERKDLPGAYGVWNDDPEWRSHVERYKSYPEGQFELDWGPASEWGTITKHTIDAAVSTKEGTGVILAVKINDRTQDAFLIVNKDHTIGFSPVEIQFRNFF